MDNLGVTVRENRCILPRPMEWLNYHHLLYFWLVAREGSVTRAAAELRLGQPTVSAQIRTLEESLGEKLFTRVGRNLTLTDIGRVVFRYADEIFSLGRELLDTVKDRPTGRPLRFTVGIADVVPKLVAHRLLQPTSDLGAPVRLVCREDKPERLLSELALYALDLVLTDGNPLEDLHTLRRPAGVMVGGRWFDGPALAALAASARSHYGAATGR